MHSGFISHKNSQKAQSEVMLTPLDNLQQKTHHFGKITEFDLKGKQGRRMGNTDERTIGQTNGPTIGQTIGQTDQ